MEHGKKSGLIFRGTGGRVIRGRPATGCLLRTGSGAAAATAAGTGGPPAGPEKTPESPADEEGSHQDDEKNNEMLHTNLLMDVVRGCG